MPRPVLQPPPTPSPDHPHRPPPQAAPAILHGPHGATSSAADPPLDIAAPRHRPGLKLQSSPPRYGPSMHPTNAHAPRALQPPPPELPHQTPHTEPIRHHQAHPNPTPPTPPP